MKNLRILFGALLCVVLASGASAQSGKNAPKSPAELASAEFFKLRDNKDTPPDEALLIAKGLAFLTTYPDSNNANAVIKGLASYGGSAKGQRLVWISKLQFEILNVRQKEGLSDAARAAIATLDASVAGFEVREAYNRDNLTAFREKIDTVAQLPANSRFLAGLEVDYAYVLGRSRPAAGEAYLKSLLEHQDPKVASEAQKALNTLEVRKHPFELSFKALDGRQVDVAKLRGKFVLLTFWTTTAKKSVEEQKALLGLHWTYAQNGLEIIGVACDKEENRPDVAKFVKDNRIPWPQYFDGQGFESELATKLNASSPVIVIFDKAGILMPGSFSIKDLEPELKKFFGIKDPPKKK